MDKVLLIFASFEAILSGFFMLTVIPQMSKTYDSLHVDNPTKYSYIYLAVIFILCLVQIIYGLKLRKLKKNNIKIEDKKEKFAIILLVLSLVSFGYLIGFAVINTIAPIYNVFSQVK